jgi:hypothetical protein
MTTKRRLTLCGLALIVPAWGLLWAAEEVAPRTTGRVLVLVNDRTLEGDIQREGNEFCVKRAVGESWVPGNRVLRLCGGWEEAYAFLQTQANLRDPDERMRLARWCQLHGLRKQALAEATAAARLRPNDPEAVRMKRLLQRALDNRVPLAAPSGVESIPVLPSSLPPVDISQESMAGFVNHVQPILMNTCARCHATNRGGEFKLLRSYHGGMLNQQATQHNLSAVMAQINVNRPRISPLLVKALSNHGHANQAPLKGRETPAFRYLEEWVETTLANNPQLVEEPVFGSNTRNRVAVNARLGPKESGPEENNTGAVQPVVQIDYRERLGNPVVAMSSRPVGESGPTQQPAALAAAVPAASKPLDPPTLLSPRTPAPQPPLTLPSPPFEGGEGRVRGEKPPDEFSEQIFNQQWHPEKSR